MLLAIGLLSIASADLALAAQGAAQDSEFQAMFLQVNKWATGNLARTIALATFLVGIGISVGKQTLFPAVMGIIVAFTAAYGPSVISSIMTATLP
jgi:type IV secretory pathway VirB2 component (pilin)